MSQFTEKEGDDCFDAIHGFEEKLSQKTTVVSTFAWHIPNALKRLIF
jgi:hypothetical protein